MLPASSASDNLRGILFMVAACSCFILNDTFVKLASEDIPVAQIIVLRSVIALPLALLFTWQRGQIAALLALRDRFLWLRTVGELGGTATFLTALAHLDIANITAITQTVPLAVTAAAALFLGERVGIRRWTAIVIGFLAVLLVIRPGTDGFNAWSLLALCSVGFVVLRDLSSRSMAAVVLPMTVTVLSLAALIPLGLAMTTFEPWRPVTPAALAYCLAAAVMLCIAYVLVVGAMRHGEISVVAPFRYVFLVWAIIIQVAVFSVWPDALTLLGSAILIATGLYTVYRERVVRRQGLRARRSEAARATPITTALPQTPV